MPEHLTETQLERFPRTPDDFAAEERIELESHVSDCPHCRERLLTLRKFYLSVEEELKQEPTQRDREFAEALIASRHKALPSEALQRQPEAVLDAYAEVIEPYRRPLVERLIRYARVHPVRFAGATAFGAAALALAILFLRPSKDPNPAHAQVKNHVLYVYNKDGEVLWTKPAPGLEDQLSNVSLAVSEPRYRAITVEDIDADGLNEVLVINPNPSRYTARSSFAGDSIYCLNRDGSLRWRAGCGEMIRFGEMHFASQGSWKVTAVFVVENPELRRSQVFAIAAIMPHWATKLFELDPKSGRELQSYWNTGELNLSLLMDLEGDGNIEIILGGINNAYRRANLVVLDPSRVGGYSPTLPDWTPSTLGRGTEKYYVLLPWTDLGELLMASDYNVTNQLFPASPEGFKVQTNEVPNEALGVGGGIVYTFGSHMEILSLIADDNFIKSHERLEKQGKLIKKLGPAYYQALKDSVLYWDGEKFVHEPTMNRLYPTRTTPP